MVLAAHGIWRIILHSYLGSISNHYKDPYYTTCIMESKRVFFVAQFKRVYPYDPWDCYIYLYLPTFTIKVSHPCGYIYACMDPMDSENVGREGRPNVSCVSNRCFSYCVYTA